MSNHCISNASDVYDAIKVRLLSQISRFCFPVFQQQRTVRIGRNIALKRQTFLIKERCVISEER